MSGSPAAGVVDGQPPETNRGVVRPDTREQGGIDYLKLTVWASVDEVMRRVEEGVLERYGWSFDPMSPREEWRELPAGGKVARVMDSGSVQVLEFSDALTNGATYCAVEAKGQTCAHLGNEGLSLLLRDLSASFRVRASRVDVMAHTTAFTPRTIRDAIHAGSFCSRSSLADAIVFIESPQGDTCYLGMKSKPTGGLKRAGERVLRAYDRRGSTRVELQLTGSHAHGAGEDFTREDVTVWPTLIRGMIRHYCDFVDRESDSRATRCPPLPWWSAFVEECEKVSTLVVVTPFEATLLGQVDGTLQRHSRKLYAALRAFGDDWIIGRIERHGGLSWTEDTPQLIEELGRV